MVFGALRAPLGHVRQSIADCLAPSIAFDPLEDLEEVMEGIDDGSLVAWVASDGDTLHSVTVVEIIEGEKGPRCFIRHCAGANLKEWLHFLPVIENWAASFGCVAVETLGRKGWERVLPDYQNRAVLLRKMLPGAENLTSMVREATHGV